MKVNNTESLGSLHSKDAFDKFLQDEYECPYCLSASLTCGCFSFDQRVIDEIKGAYRASMRKNANPYSPSNRTVGKLVVLVKGNEKEPERIFARFKRQTEPSGYSHIVAINLPPIAQEICRSLALRS